MKGLLSRFITVGATAFWAVSLTLMVAASAGDHSTLLAHWALLTGLWACVLTGWGLLGFERCRIEDVATIAAKTAIEHRGLRSAD